jgi:hypothetical protein
VELKKFGNAIAFSIKIISGPSFNTVKGLKEGDEKEIEKIIDFYQQKGIPVRFELSPAFASSDLLTYLSEKGFYPHDFHTALYRSLSNKSEPIDGSISPKIFIRELKRDEFEMFAEIYQRVFKCLPF